MKAKLDLEINVQEIIELRETHWDFTFATELAPEDLVRAFELSTEEIDFKEVDRFGDLNSFFGLNIEFNPHLWALVWGSGYNVQFNLYADTYDEKCVDVFASLGLVVLLCRCERNNRTLQAANLIMKARDKALLLLRTQPKKLRRDDSEIDAEILKRKQDAESCALRRSRELQIELVTLGTYLENDKQSLKARLKESKQRLNARLSARRLELEKALEELKTKEIAETEDLEREEQEGLRRLEERYESEKARLKKNFEDEQSTAAQSLTISNISREAFTYTEEQRKANKARASAIRLKARTMSFVDKRSIR